MNAFFDKNGNTFTGIVAECSDEMEDFVIREKMLDGTFAVQKVRRSVYVFGRGFYCSRETRRSIELASANGDLVVLSWRKLIIPDYLDDEAREALAARRKTDREKIKI